MTPRLAALAATLSTLAVVGLALLLWRPWSRAKPATPPAPAATSRSASFAPDRTPTSLYAHNLRLLKGPDFRVYIRWIRGQMVRTHREVNPSLDDPE